MKAITEFPIFTLNKALAAKTAMAAEGKSLEEIQQNIADTFKYEGDKLKHFMNAVDVAGQNQKDLRRVLVVSLNEGENAPSKSTKVEDFYYIPETLILKAVSSNQSDKGGRSKRGGKGGGDRKGSPWGLSPEDKAAKAGKTAAAKNSDKN